MKPAPFDYVTADSVEHAVTQLAAANEDGEGKIIAGGQSLMPLLALRLAQPSILIDINRVPGLAEISPLPGGLRIGALTRHSTLAAQSEPASDIHATAGYRRQLTRVLAARALAQAAGAQAA